MAGIPFILQFLGQEPSICPKSFIAVFEFLILHSRHTHSSEGKTDGLIRHEKNEDQRGGESQVWAPSWSDFETRLRE